MKNVVFLLIFCFTSLASYSQTKQESIKELFHVMQVDSLTDKMFSSVFPSMFKQMRSQFPAKDSLSVVRTNEIMKSIMEMAKVINDRMREDMVPLYDKYFSQNEINDYIAFYKSPSGQKSIKLMPEIQKDIMNIMMQNYMPEMQKKIKEKAEEMKNAKQK
jgi:hypothetical protein